MAQSVQRFNNGISMEKPKAVRQGVLLIWLSVAICAIGAVAIKHMGGTVNDFVVSLCVYALFCILPYKIGNGSNAARVSYAVLVAVSVLIVLGGVYPSDDGMSRGLEIALLVLSSVLEFIALYFLFRRESSAWFTYCRQKS
jgi:hypothetical protein